MDEKGEKMKDFKEEIAICLTQAINLPKEELKDMIEVPKDEKNGDYALPCFRFAKMFGKSPMLIAEELKEKLNISRNRY